MKATILFYVFMTLFFAGISVGIAALFMTVHAVAALFIICAICLVLLAIFGNRQTL